MESRPTIAVVGASVRAVAFSLLRADCHVMAADLFADADLARECPVTRITDYSAGLVDWLSHAECDGCLYTGALENHPELIDRLAALRPLLGNHGASLRRVRDPLELQRVLYAAGLNFPETKLCDGPSPGDGEWVHKTGQGGNGSGVTTYSSEPPGLSQRGEAAGSQGRGYWQRKIDGVPGSALYIDGRLHGVTRQLVGESWVGAGEFQYCGTLAPWNLPMGANAELVPIGKVLARCGLRGLLGVDFILDGERVWCLEVNPRPTAAVEIVERVSGVNLLAKHLAAFGIQTQESPREPITASGKAILYAKHPLAVSRDLSQRLLAMTGPLELPQLADIPHPGTEISVGDPILTVLADGSSIDAVSAELRERVVSLEAELYRG